MRAPRRERLHIEQAEMRMRWAKRKQRKLRQPLHRWQGISRECRFGHHSLDCPKLDCRCACHDDD